MNNQKCNPYCPPFVIYVILGVVSILANLIRPNTLTVKATVISANIVSLLIFGSLFYWLCLNCHQNNCLDNIIITSCYIYYFINGFFGIISNNNAKFIK